MDHGQDLVPVLTGQLIAGQLIAVQVVSEKILFKSSTHQQSPKWGAKWQAGFGSIWSLVTESVSAQESCPPRSHIEYSDTS